MAEEKIQNTTTLLTEEKKNEVKTIINKETLKAQHDGKIKLDDVVDSFIIGYKKDGTEKDQETFSSNLSKYLEQEAFKHACASEYNVLVLFDNTTLLKGDSDQIYRAINRFVDKNKPLILVLLSRGGDLGAAYLIGKLCREFSTSKFIVVVPRYAKSVATLLACAADEVHMGSLSELGPIDPQIDGMPALGLKNSIEHIADLVNKNPGSGEMFARYLKLTIDPIQIGYYERVAESAKQYAERLLAKHKMPMNVSDSTIIARKLVYDYKDHGFVIDKEEAKNIFGANMIKSNTSEYEMGNVLYNIFSEIERFAEILDYNFYFIGTLDSSPTFVKKSRNRK